MVSPSPAPRLVMRLEDWPSGHRALFLEGTRPRTESEDENYASDRQPTTLRNAERGWGRFLFVLEEAGALDRSARPASMVIPANVRLFRAGMKQAGNGNNSIITRLFDLQAALQVMEPERSFTWLTSPGGVSIRKRLPISPKPKEPMHSGVLWEWGFQLMKDAPLRGKATERLSQYRNGLLIALEAHFAPRLRSITALRLGRQIVRRGEGFRMVFTAVDIKNKRERVDFLIPDELVPSMEHYLQVVRPALLGEKACEWFWVHAQGERFDYRGIEGMLRRESKRQFGKAFGTNHFRHSLGTTLARAHPDRPGLVSKLLANTPKVSDDYYILVRGEEAIAFFLRHVRDDRARFRDLGPHL